MVRRVITVHGVVQGVGFRPFVHAAAMARGLAGWVRNRADGVRIEVEGPEPAVEDFVKALAREAPPAARLTRVQVSEVHPRHERAFHILASDPEAPPRPTVPADRLPARSVWRKWPRPGSGASAIRSPTAPGAGRAGRPSSRFPMTGHARP
ncbi:acylphosphatase [Cystobacter fuscus]